MKNQITKISAMLSLLFVLAIASVSAQMPQSVQVNIPFDFAAGKATLKSGAYTIRRTSGNALTIKSADGKTVLVNAPLAIGSRDYKAGARLVFNRYGDQYFLSQVWLSPDSGRQIFTSGAEARAARELAKTNAKPERIEIAASGR